MNLGFYILKLYSLHQDDSKEISLVEIHRVLKTGNILGRCSPPKKRPIIGS